MRQLVDYNCFEKDEDTKGKYGLRVSSDLAKRMGGSVIVHGSEMADPDQ